MVQYILKRDLTGSTVTVDANDSINELWTALDSMIIALSVLKIVGDDQRPLPEGMLPEDAFNECKQIFMQRLGEDVSENLLEMGEGWNFEDLIMPTKHQDD